MRLFIIAVLLMISTFLSGQTLESYRWQKRLLIITDFSNDHAKYLQQLSLFQKNQVGLNDRRLKVISFTSKGMQEGLNHKNPWQRMNPPAKFQSKKIFNVFLVGLDGGIKATFEQPTELLDFFELIDQMPMRQAELSRQKN